MGIVQILRSILLQADGERETTDGLELKYILDFFAKKIYSESVIIIVSVMAFATQNLTGFIFA